MFSFDFLPLLPVAHSDLPSNPLFEFQMEIKSRLTTPTHAPATPVHGQSSVSDYAISPMYSSLCPTSSHPNCQTLKIFFSSRKGAKDY